jgi:GTPase SAR1 family protein
MKPLLIQDIEKQLGQSLKRLDPPPAPPLDAVYLQDAVRYENNNSYCCDAAGKLLTLNISENDKLESIRFMEDDAGLEYLNLGENKNLQRVDFEVGLPHLKYADLSECGLREIQFPAGFDQLEKLYLQKNGLEKVEFGKGFVKLFFLDLSGNKLSKFELPGGFNKLKYLYLSGNQLTELHIPKPLLCLEVLHLRGNLLPQLPKNLLAYSNLNNLYLHGNPLQDIPKDFIAGEENGNSWLNVKSYLTSKQHGQMIHLRQAKMILVGNGEVGKSSIRIKLMNPDAKLPEKHERTPGLDIETYTLEINDRELTGINGKLDFDLCIWDFGGQGKYREVQQLFCSRKSLYLFVTAPDDTPEKEDYIGFNYWLSMVNAFSYDEQENRHSPVIHVVNKVDKEMTLVDEKTLKERFQNIENFVKISCLKEPLLLNLKDAMRKSLRNVSDDIFDYPINQYWLDVKAELESRQKDNHIYWQDYLQLCTKDGLLTYDEAVTWIEVLDRIGTVIYFGKNEALKDLIILNPLWVKDAICRVIDSPQVRNGLLYPALLPDIWKGYSDEERKQLLEIMLAYKLCYRQSDDFGQDEYVVPSMLNDTKPRFPDRLAMPDFQLKLVWSPFIPAGTVNKLMVGLHGGTSHFSGRLEHTGISEKIIRLVQPSIYKNLLWKNNVVVHDAENDAYAHVQEDWENKTVFVSMFGKEAEPLFDYLMASFDDINQTLKNTKYLSNLSLEAQCWHEDEWMNLATLKKLKIDFFKLTNSSNSMNPIQELVRQGRLKEALNELFTKTPTNLKNDVATLQSKLAVLERKEMLGTIRHDDAGIERSNIVEAALHLNDLLNVPPPPPFDKKEQNEPDHNGDRQNTTPPPKDEQAPSKTKILFVAANPDDEARIKTDKEHRLLKEQLDRGRSCDDYEFLHPQFAVTIQELIRAFNQAPNIVHFSGHADRDGIFITNDKNLAVPMGIPALERLFNQVVGHCRIVVLNACSTTGQAEAISRLGIYVVGTNARIEDGAAISFSQGFYNGLGEGKPFEKAYNDAMTTVLVEYPNSAPFIEAWKDGVKLML